MKNIYKTLSITTLLAATLYAEPITYTINPIVVSASKTEQTLNNTTANIDVISGEELEEKHYTSVTQALNAVTGVSFTSNGGMGSTQSVFMRGMDTKHLLVLVNGIRFQDPSNTSGASFTHLLISDIERIEVLKGAQSGIWGADASAGVINIITKKAKRGTHTGLQLEGGSFNTKKLGAYVSHQGEIYDLRLGFDRVMSDSFTTKAPIGSDIDSYEDDPYSNTTVNLNGHWYPTANDTVTLNYTDINALSNYDTYSDPDALQRSDVRTKLYGVAYDKKYEQHKVTLKANSSRFTRDELDTTYGVKVFEGQTDVIEASDRISYGKEDFLLVGGSQEKFAVDIAKYNASTSHESVTNNAFFATNSNRFGTLLFTQSLRYDDYSNFNAKTTGKVGAKYQAAKEFYISANYGSAYTAPNLIQILNPWGNANTQLKPENSKGFDVSVGYKKALLTYFDSKVEDLIEWTGTYPNNFYDNLDGISTFKGVEFSYETKLASVIALKANYTQLFKFEDKDGKDLIRRSKREAQMMLDYYATDALHIGVDMHYVGTRYDDTAQTKQTGRYTLTDLVVNYEIAPEYKIYGKIENLSDKYYQVTDGYATAPRAFYLGFKASF